jgi:hypothetical protein
MAQIIKDNIGKMSDPVVIELKKIIIEVERANGQRVKIGAYNAKYSGIINSILHGLVNEGACLTVFIKTDNGERYIRQANNGHGDGAYNCYMLDGDDRDTLLI